MMGGVPANLLREDAYLVNTNLIAPNVNGPWVNLESVPWNQARGVLFQLRQLVRRISPSAGLTTAFELMVSIDSAAHIKVTEITPDIRMGVSGLFSYQDQCFDLFMDGGAGDLITVNGHYVTSPGGFETADGAWPNANNRRVAKCPNTNGCCRRSCNFNNTEHRIYLW